MSSESSESGVSLDVQRMRIDSSCSCDYAVEYDAFLASLRELAATPATTLKVVLDHMRRTNRPTNLLEYSMHQSKSLDIEHIHSFTARCYTIEMCLSVRLSITHRYSVETVREDWDV